MKLRNLTFLLLSLLLASCQGAKDAYADLNCLTVTAVWPEGYAPGEAAAVKVEDINLGYSYSKTAGSDGRSEFRVRDGLYRVTVTDRSGEDIFNGTLDRLAVTGGGDHPVTITLLHSKSGSIVIKEIYCGGCKRLPQEGDYQSDQYIILHNNDLEVQYLDGLCLGTLYPYNSNATNPFAGKDPATGELTYADYAPIAQAVWQFSGDGTSHPLQPGEDAVVALRGAVDHTVQYPLSVNLDRPGYFVCYNNTYFTNTTYHPAPGANIAEDHILDVVVKTGRANAYTFSINSPTALIWRAQGMTMKEFVQQEGSVVQVPGSSVDQVTAVPLDWIIDAVEVFNGASSSNAKRLVPSLDAGYVTLSDTFLGHSLMRSVDEALSAGSGFEVLQDTNNSSNDFYERETQSLHD